MATQAMNSFILEEPWTSWQCNVYSVQLTLAPDLCNAVVLRINPDNVCKVFGI